MVHSWSVDGLLMVGRSVVGWWLVDGWFVVGWWLIVGWLRSGWWLVEGCLVIGDGVGPA